MSEEQMNEQQHENALPLVADSNTAPASPGSILAARRESRGWTVAQVASQLKMSPRQIAALEADDYASLPSAVTTRGFLRTYAKFLDLDPTPWLPALPSDANTTERVLVPHRSLATPFSESPLPLGSRRGALPLWTIAIVVLVLLAAFVIGERIGVLPAIPQVAFLHAPAAASASAASAGKPAAAEDATELPEVASSNQDRQAGPESTEHQPDRVNTGSEPVAAMRAPAGAMGASALSPMSPAASGTASAAAPANAMVAGSTPGAAMPATAATAADNAGQPPVKAPPGSAATPSINAVGGKLNMTVRQDTWVEIRRADKTVVVSRLLKAGSVESFDIDQPAAMVVGNVAGVDVTLRGAPLDLKAGSGNNVARLNLK